MGTVKMLDEPTCEELRKEIQEGLKLVDKVGPLDDDIDVTFEEDQSTKVGFSINWAPSRPQDKDVAAGKLRSTEQGAPNLAVCVDSGRAKLNVVALIPNLRNLLRGCQ